LMPHHKEAESPPQPHRTGPNEAVNAGGIWN
jgi:hypothetical protein